MITYDELKTALTDIGNICRMTDCDKCPFAYEGHSPYGLGCLIYDNTPNNWLDKGIDNSRMQQFADRGAHLVEEGYIDE